MPFSNNNLLGEQSFLGFCRTLILTFLYFLITTSVHIAGDSKPFGHYRLLLQIQCGQLKFNPTSAKYPNMETEVESKEDATENQNISPFFKT